LERPNTGRRSSNQIHISCSRHHLDYQHWTWRLRDSSTLHDQGFEMELSKPFHKKLVRWIRTTASAKFPTIALSHDQDGPVQHHGKFFSGLQQIGLSPSEQLWGHTSGGATSALFAY